MLEKVPSNDVSPLKAVRGISIVDLKYFWNLATPPMVLARCTSYYQTELSWQKIDILAPDLFRRKGTQNFMTFSKAD